MGYQCIHNPIRSPESDTECTGSTSATVFKGYFSESGMRLPVYEPKKNLKKKHCQAQKNERFDIANKVFSTHFGSSLSQQHLVVENPPKQKNDYCDRFANENNAELSPMKVIDNRVFSSQPSMLHTLQQLVAENPPTNGNDDCDLSATESDAELSPVAKGRQKKDVYSYVKHLFAKWGGENLECDIAEQTDNQAFTEQSLQVAVSNNLKTQEDLAIDVKYDYSFLPSVLQETYTRMPKGAADDIIYADYLFHNYFGYIYDFVHSFTLFDDEDPLVLMKIASVFWIRFHQYLPLPSHVSVQKFIGGMIMPYTFHKGQSCLKFSQFLITVMNNHLMENQKVSYSFCGLQSLQELEYLLSARGIKVPDFMGDRHLGEKLFYGGLEAHNLAKEDGQAKISKQPCSVKILRLESKQKGHSFEITWACNFKILQLESNFGAQFSEQKITLKDGLQGESKLRCRRGLRYRACCVPGKHGFHEALRHRTLKGKKFLRLLTEFHIDSVREQMQDMKIYVFTFIQLNQNAVFAKGAKNNPVISDPLPQAQCIVRWEIKVFVSEDVQPKLMVPPPILGATQSNLRDERSRLQTFRSLNKELLTVPISELVAAGFYVHHDNIVRCYSCHLQHNIRDFFIRSPVAPQWHLPNCQHLNNIQESFNFRQVANDGRVSDDIGDPPGQQSIYIRPGDARREDYRLSTFEKFPVSSPISRKSLAKSGFYFTGFYDRVKCFACGRTVERWEAMDNPAELRWHKPTCPFPRGEECGNVPVFNLFQQTQSAAGSQGHEVLEQRDPSTGALVRRVRYPSELPARIRESGGTFEIGPGNSVIIRSGPGAQNNPVVRVGNEAAQQPPPREWRMANVISGDLRRFLTNLYLNRELDRLASFARWPVGRPTISPAFLAKSGFFYLGDMDRTQCFSCGGVLRNWTVDDDAFTEHRSHFPQCAMVLGTETRNIPVPEHPETPEQRDTNYPCRFPANPHMRTEAGRLETFDHRWPTGRTSATPAEIAQAGFFFLGERDRVKCWYCNGGLQNWEYDDIPWVEHAKWFPNCQFLLKVKGQHFSYRHLALHPHLARPILAKQQGSPLDGADHNQPRSRDIPPSESEPQPVGPPTIIDPQEEMRKRKEKVKNIMRKSEVAKYVLTMGFDEKIVAALLEDRLNAGNVANPEDIYGSVSELLDDVMTKEEELKKEEERKRAPVLPAAVAIAAAGPSSLGTVSSVYSSMPGTSMMSSLGPAPGSGKYAVSMYGYDDDEDEKMDVYGSGTEPSSIASVTELKQPLGAEGNSASLQEALNKIEEERMCKICFTNPADMVFLPCSHMCCCMECTQAIRQCPVCRKPIEKAIKTYTN